MKYNPKSWGSLDKFDNSGEKWDKDFKNVILSWVLKYNPDTLLDVACCVGHYARKLRKEGWDGDYTGVDVTASFIKRAKKLSKKETFFVQDARDLHDIKDNSFSMVLLLGVIMHIDDYASAIKEAFRVAKDSVIIMAYASKTGRTYSRNNAGFINRYFTFDEIVKYKPSGYRVSKFSRCIGSRDRWIVMFDEVHK